MTIDRLAILLLGIFIGLLLGRYVKFAKKSGAAANTPPGAAPAQSITVQAVNAKGRGESVTLAPELLAEIHELLQAGQQAEAIQRVRAACGLDAKSSKAIVEALQNMMQ
ncbi:MAG: hypothetical protein EPN21_03450 [Methylococcaceae bacterium]|nr:MAG: hypothetical protein EPN21_03450 [Methylococcaceae bacterium]